MTEKLSFKEKFAYALGDASANIGNQVTHAADGGRCGIIDDGERSRIGKLSALFIGQHQGNGIRPQG